MKSKFTPSASSPPSSGGGAESGGTPDTFVTPYTPIDYQQYGVTNDNNVRGNINDIAPTSTQLSSAHNDYEDPFVFSQFPLLSNGKTGAQQKLSATASTFNPSNTISNTSFGSGGAKAPIIVHGESQSINDSARKYLNAIITAEQAPELDRFLAKLPQDVALSTETTITRILRLRGKYEEVSIGAANNSLYVRCPLKSLQLCCMPTITRIDIFAG